MGPLMSREAIMKQYAQGVEVNPQWVQNAKGPLANHFGGSVPKFSSIQTTIEGKQVWRYQVVADKDRGIIGVGDHAVKKEAEKLAALSAVVQLVASGLVSIIIIVAYPD
jgi:small subunit ribosomal protein S24e